MRYYHLPLLIIMLAACSPERTEISRTNSNRYQYLAVDEAQALDGAEDGTVRHISAAAEVTKFLNAKASEGWEFVQVDRWSPNPGTPNGNIGYTTAKYIFRRPAK